MSRYRDSPDRYRRRSPSPRYRGRSPSPRYRDVGRYRSPLRDSDYGRDRYRSPPRDRYRSPIRDRYRSPPRYRDDDRYDRRSRDRYDDRRRGGDDFGWDRNRRDRDRGFGNRDRGGFVDRQPYDRFNNRRNNNNNERRGGPYNGNRPQRTVFTLLLSNLHRAITWIDIKDLAKDFGTCTYADANKVRTGEGIVAFSDAEGMIKAKEGMNNYDLRGLRMKVEYEFPETAEPGWTGKVNNDHPAYFTARDGDRHGRDRGHTPEKARKLADEGKRSRSGTPKKEMNDDEDDDARSNEGSRDYKRGSRSRSISR